MRPWQLPIVISLLMLIGILTLRSLAPDLLSKHLLFCTFGWAIFFVSSKLSFKSWLEVVSPGMVIWLGLLLLLLILPQERSTARWFTLGPLLLQPSQLTVPIVGLFMSQKISQQILRDFNRLLPHLAPISLSIVLILLEPDFGSAMVFLSAIALTLLLAGLQFKTFVKLSLIGTLMAILAWFFVLKPYQKERLTSFFSPKQAAAASSYNARQAVISVGAGGWWGVGLGKGSQSQLKFLPERHTDFIFAAMAEETGFVGGMMVIGLYSWLTLSLLTQAKRATFANRFFLLLTSVWLTIQTSINIGMNIGLVPVTGLTLPLISYGGSSLISTMWLLGLVQSTISESQSVPNLHLT